MNYIKKLQATIQNHKANKEEAEATLRRLEKYLLSEKFHCGDELDGYVNVKDVLSYIAVAIDDLRNEDYRCAEVNNEVSFS